MPTPFIPAPLMTRTSLLYRWNGQRVVNTLHHKWPTTPDVPTMILFNVDLKTWWDANMKNSLSSDIGLEQIVTVDLTTQSSPSATLSINPTDMGGDGAGSVYLNDALCISFRTAQRGRNYRGRNYIPAIWKNRTLDSGRYDPAWVSTLITAMTALLTSANFHNAVLSVVSYFLNKTPRGSAIGTPVTAFVADNLIDSQRRRLIGRGQ
jgi:hypothetical protein